ncbi:TPA: hypothetical protein N2D99_002343 [Clostridium botulinum]|nr:hypothetical protein [Clostridium botulinum]
MKRHKLVVMLAALIFATGTNLIPAHAEKIKENVPIVQAEDRRCVSMKILTEKFNGKIERFDGQSEHYTTYTLRDKSIRIWDGYACAFVNGSYTPFETREVQGFTVPAWYVPKQVNGDVMVPVSFVEKILGAKAEGDKVTFEVNKLTDGSNNSKTANSGTTNTTANNGSHEVDTHNRPISNGNTSNNTNSDSTTKSSTGSGTKPAQKQKVYTGTKVKNELYNLGFFNKGSGLEYNSRGAKGDASTEYAQFFILSGNTDMRLCIHNSDATFDQKLKTLFGYILPNSSSKLYSTIDNPNVKSQTLTMDGRKIDIEVYGGGIIIDFGPMIE